MPIPPMARERLFGQGPAPGSPPAPAPQTLEIDIDEETGAVHVRDPAEAARPRPAACFDDNLAEALDDGALGAIAESLLRGIEADERSRREMLEHYTRGMDLLGLKLDGDAAGFAGGQGGKTISRIRHPILLWACVRFQSGARNELLPAAGPVKAAISSAEDAAAQALAKDFERDFNHYLTVTASEYYPDTDRGLFYLGYGGTLFKKIYRCPLRKRPVSECVYMPDLVVSNDATDLANAQRVTHRFEMAPATVRLLQQEGFYRDAALAPPAEASLDPAKRKEAEIAGVAAQRERQEDRQHTILECYCALDLAPLGLDEKGAGAGRALPYRVSIDQDSRTVLEIRRNWRQGDPGFARRRRFVKYGLVPGFGFYDYGFLHLIGNHTKALTALWRLVIDAGMFSTFPGGLRLKGSRASTNEFRPGPGEFPEIDAAGVEDIRKLNPTQQTAFNEINAAQGSALPYINAAQSYLGAGADNPFSQVMSWTPSTLAQFENPYTQQVTQATQNLLNEQNAEQFNQARGSAAAAGAFGGDREAVLEAQMAQQQQLAEAPTLAGIQSQGFNTAAGLLGQQQNLQLQGLEGNSWLNENAAAMEAGLGQQAQGSLLSGASSELQAGALGQQLEQELLNVPIEQFAQQQAYPFETTNFLAGITEGAGGGMGGTGSTTSPGPSMLGQVAGLGMTGLGLYGMGVNQGWWGPGTAAADNAAGGMMGAAAANDAAGGSLGTLLESARRGGRVVFPSLRRDIGGFVPAPALPGVAGMSAGDFADIGKALALAGASPIPPMATPRGAGGLPFAAPSGVANTNQDTTGQTIGTLAQLGMMAAMAFSDPALKQTRGEAKGALAALRRMKVDDARYHWEAAGAERPMLMADSVERAAPHAVAGEAPVRAVKPLELIPMLVRGIQELDRRSRRRGGRLVPGHHHAGFPKALAAGGESSADLDNMLIAAGAGMMASRSPFFLTQLGDGMQSALRYGQGQRLLARDQNRAGPHIDAAGATMRLIYPNGGAFDTGLGTR